MKNVTHVGGERGVCDVVQVPVPATAASRTRGLTSVSGLRTLRRSTELPVPADDAWALVQRADTFVYVTRPLLGVRDPLPETLGQGETLTLRLRVLGIPAYRHTLHLETVDEGNRTIQTREHGGALRTWDHTIRIEPLTEATCRYTDEVEIDAGRLTPVAHAVASALFAHRQRRWHKLVAG